MASWGLLNEKDENELHRSRLLKVEEKPLQRVTKHLANLHSIASSKSRQAPTPPPETPDANGSSTDPSAADLTQLREDIVLDFAAFDSNIARLQFLLSANERERERYAAKRDHILEESQAVRDKTTELRDQLDEARATLEQRKKFDELADKITSNKNLRTRTEQAANLKKLQEEIAELEDESETYAVTWQERREQFSRIMDESMRLRRLIRDEKEEVERREGMDDQGGAGDAEVEGSQTPRPGIASGNATPRPESGSLLKGVLEPGDVVGSPMPASTIGGQTPARESPAPGESQISAKPRFDNAGTGSHSESQIPSREQSPNRRDSDAQGGDQVSGDVEMEDSKVAAEEDDAMENSVTPSLGTGTPAIVVDSLEEDDKMDTT